MAAGIQAGRVRSRPGLPSTAFINIFVLHPIGPEILAYSQVTRFFSGPHDLLESGRKGLAGQVTNYILDCLDAKPIEKLINQIA